MIKQAVESRCWKRSKGKSPKPEMVILKEEEPEMKLRWWHKIILRKKWKTFIKSGNNMNQAILPRKSPKNGVQERRERKVLQRITLWLPQFGLQISTHTHTQKDRVSACPANTVKHPKICPKRTDATFLMSVCYSYFVCKLRMNYNVYRKMHRF